MRWWFWVENTIQVESTLSNNAEEEKKIDVTEKIKETVTQEGTTTTTSSNNTLTEEDKKAVKSLVDGLIVK